MRHKKKKKVVNPLYIGQYEINRVLPFDDLYTKYKEHHRLRVFVEKGLKCAYPDCPCEGSLLLEGKERAGFKHVDVYTKDLEMMTIDHIIPKSKGGGKKDLNNLQPMCQFHNELKTNKII